MKNIRSIVAAILFFIVAVLFIAFHSSFRFFLPAQQVELSHGVEYGAVVKDFLFVQEITMQKRYISRVDLYMAKLPSTYANENVFLLLNEQHQILYTRRFSSSDFGEALYFPFDFGKNLDIGAGKKVYACIHSIDGDQGSYIGLAKKQNSNLGKLYVVTIVNNDIVQSFEKQQSRVDFVGSIGVRTFESGTRFFSMLQVILYLLTAAISILLLFSGKVLTFISRTRILPEYAFAGFSVVFGLIIMVITPPFMVPDEAAHFYRSYEISEFNIFKFSNEVPASLVDFTSECDRMRFSTHEKTTRAEVISMSAIRLNPHNRTKVESPDYTITYLPQATGIFIGRLLQLSPLWLMYLGRLFNMLVSILLVYLAIRSTPVLKWLFFLLGVMPMTLYLFSSLSYDALTISLSFLLIATILKHAFSDGPITAPGKLAMVFVLAALLAAAKPPYFLIVFAFLIIPVEKLGNLKRYSVVFIALVAMALIVSQVSAPGRSILGKAIASAGNIPAPVISFPEEESMHMEQANHNPLSASLPLLPHGFSGGQASEKAPDTTGQAAQPAQSSGAGSAGQPASQHQSNPYDAAAQKQFILDDPARFIGIMFTSIISSIGLYAVGFVGLFGWVDTPLPSGLAYAYLFFLLLVVLVYPSSGAKINIVRKLLLFGIFAACLALIETAMYLYCNPVGSSTVIAVQGRYFIAVCPILLMVFLNGTLYRFVGKMFLPSAVKPASGKQVKKQSSVRATSGDVPVSETISWTAMVIAFATLVISVYVILERYYVLTM